MCASVCMRVCLCVCMNLQHEDLDSYQHDPVRASTSRVAHPGVHGFPLRVSCWPCSMGRDGHSKEDRNDGSNCCAVSRRICSRLCRYTRNYGIYIYQRRSNSKRTTFEIVLCMTTNLTNPKRCKTSSVGQSAGLLILRSSVRFRQKLNKLRTQIYMDLRYIDPQARVLNYFYK